MSSKRLLRDIQGIKEDTEWSFEVIPSEASINELTCTFPGPQKSPYAGGVFAVKLTVPREYPLKPPQARFETKVYHPNVSSQTGAICLDILGNAWTPVYTIKSVLISLQQLLDAPNPNDPQDAQVAKQMVEDNAAYERTAQEWTQKYAQPTPAASLKIDPAFAQQLEAMGFSGDAVNAAASKLGLSSVSSEQEFQQVVEALLG